MKFPYGITDFRKIITNGYFYCDRTDKIPLLEQAESQLFIRPRRFGKSLLLSMLENYYDVGRKDEFEKIFGHLAIGKNPTEYRNSYFILRWDFSCIESTGTPEQLRSSLFDHINDSIRSFYLRYTRQSFDLPEIEINRENCLSTLNSFFDSVQTTGIPVYLLLDEYDNFANTIMMQAGERQERYESLVRDEGLLRTLFKAIKSATSGSMFDRVFITGVSPVVLSDITSGYNIAENVYFSRKFNDLCGFREEEVKAALEGIVAECGEKRERTDQAVMLARTYYDGYRFCRRQAEKVYNPTLCLYFFKQFQEECEIPFEMLDTNLAVDDSKLEYITRLPQGKELIVRLSQRKQQLVVERVNQRFGVKDMLGDVSKDQTFLASYLYYFGVLTLDSTTDKGQPILKVPNLVMQSLYIERVQRMLLPDPLTRDDGIRAAELVYQEGDIAPLCEFVQNSYFQVLTNRDYRWANELTLKTAFLTLLYNDILFIMDSEPETGRGYADLTMIIRPDQRRFKLFDVLLEFKFISLKELGVKGEEIRGMGDEELRELPLIRQNFREAASQALRYAASLNEKYGNLRLQTFVVVSLGFERVLWEKIFGNT